MVAVLGLGILFLPESISISSFSNNHPSSSEDVLIDTNTNEGSIEANTSAESYSSGMKTGYGATPFKLDAGGSNSQYNPYITAYVGADGYLYASGYSADGYSTETNYHYMWALGNGNSRGSTTFIPLYKSGSNTTANYFKNPIDYAFATAMSYTTVAPNPTSVYRWGHGMVIDSTGKVWASGENAEGQLGIASTSDKSSFTAVATSTTAGYLPSTYKAVAVSVACEANEFSDGHSLLLTDDGALYAAGVTGNIGVSGDKSTFYRIDGVATNLPAATSSNPIVDFAATHGGTAVLYANGNLYYNGNGGTSFSLVNPSGVKITMFDADSGTITYMSQDSYIRAVGDDNKIYYKNTDNTTVLASATTPVGTVVQVRATGNAWGYLNSAGDLYTALSGTATPTLTVSSIKYFDLAGGGSGEAIYGALTTSGVTKLCGDGQYYSFGNGSTTDLTYANAVTPTIGGGADDGYFTNKVPAITAPANKQLNPPNKPFNNF